MKLYALCCAFLFSANYVASCNAQSTQLNSYFSQVITDCTASPDDLDSVLSCTIYVSGVNAGALAATMKLTAARELKFERFGEIMSDSMGYCIPPTVSVGTMASVFQSYLRRNPAMHSVDPARLVMESLSEAWPCEASSR
jgi:hypothetical protein